MPINNISVVKQSDNKLIGHREYVFRIDYDDGTPSREEIRGLIASKLGIDGNKLIIVRVDSAFGANTSLVTARIYSSEEVLKRFEPKFLLIRDGLMPRPEKRQT